MSRSYRHGKYRKVPDDNWCSTEPKWWRKMMKHRKRRAQLRECISRFWKGHEDIDWPRDKKPWLYYW